MFHSRKNIDTIRRCSQRQNNRRLARIQRQVVLETVVSNLSSRVCQSSATIFTRSPLESIQSIQQDKNNEIDDLSLSISSDLLNISNVHLNVVESMPSSENNNVTEVHLRENRPSFCLSHSEQAKPGEEVVEDSDSSMKSDENDDEQKLLVDSDDEELSVDADDDGLFNHYNNQTDRQFTYTEIALALSLLKSRYSLTHSCISNICRLLKLLHVPNCPTDFRHIRSLICNPYETTIFARESLISCPSCRKISSNSGHCTSSTTCINKDTFITNPTINHILHIEPQIRSVLERTNLVKPANSENIVTDIVDSPFYRELLRVEDNPFITLLLNSDGAVVKSISRSIWITTFVINELPPSIRFNRENLIVGMVSVGASKPQKDEMQIFLNSLVKELHYLENHGVQYSPINSPSHINKTVRVYLILASCDMPARSLLINHTEVTGYFGCIHCKIAGENMHVGEGHARVFVYDENNDAVLRSNDSYDEAIRLLEKPLGRRRRASVNSIDNGLFGLRGSCAFRQLKHFDIYQSFTSDTLHTLYEGVTSRMLKILLGNVSQKAGISDQMTVKKDIDTLTSTFNSIFYPSSTYRIPRDLKHHSIFKANELKMFLLFGYSIFDGILTAERYNHFKCLAFAAHLIEASTHDQSTYLEIMDLLNEFDKRFESLYTKRQAKPVIHALTHFTQSTRNYGPSHNYSTFEFESAVAALTKTIHNGNKPTIELLKNIDLLQQTWMATSDPSFPAEMKLFDYQIHCNRRFSIPTHLSNSHHHQHKTRIHKKMCITSLASDVSDFILKIVGDRSYVLYKTIFVDRQRYSADPTDIHRSTHDGCVLYDLNDATSVGFLQTIIHFINNNEFSLVIRPVVLYSTADTLSINNRVYRCTNVLYGTSHGSSIQAIHYKSLIQKLSFRYGTNSNFSPLVDSMFFFQFPNLHSST